MRNDSVVKNVSPAFVLVAILMVAGCQSITHHSMSYTGFNHGTYSVGGIKVISNNGHGVRMRWMDPESGSGIYIGSYYYMPDNLTVAWTTDVGWDRYRYKKIITVPRPLPELVQHDDYIDYNRNERKSNYTLALHFFDDDVQVQVIGDSESDMYWRKGKYQKIETDDNDAELLWIKTLTISERSYYFTIDNQSEYPLLDIRVVSDEGSGAYLKRIDVNTSPVKQQFGDSIIPYLLRVRWIKDIDGHPVKMEKELHIPRPLPELEPGQWFGSIKSDNHYNITLTFTDDDVSFAVSVEGKELEPSLYGWQPVHTTH